MSYLCRICVRRRKDLVLSGCHGSVNVFGLIFEMAEPDVLFAASSCGSRSSASLLALHTQARARTTSANWMAHGGLQDPGTSCFFPCWHLVNFSFHTILMAHLNEALLLETAKSEHKVAQ